VGEGTNSLIVTESNFKNTRFHKAIANIKPWQSFFMRVEFNKFVNYLKHQEFLHVQDANGF
jgi:hypothetical protein